MYRLNKRQQLSSTNTLKQKRSAQLCINQQSCFPCQRRVLQGAMDKNKQTLEIWSERLGWVTSADIGFELHFKPCAKYAFKSGPIGLDLIMSLFFMVCWDFVRKCLFGLRYVKRNSISAVCLNAASEGQVGEDGDSFRQHVRWDSTEVKHEVRGGGRRDVLGESS